MAAGMRFFVAILVLLLSGAASAQEPKGWIGADVQDVNKAEADKLGWDGPRGAKLRLVAPGSPVDKAGLREGDIVESVDGVEVETSTGFDAAIAAKPPNAEVRLRVRSGARERRVTVKIAERPMLRVADTAAMPILMLDPGGHMALIRGLAFTPDGKHLVSAGDDKMIRVWDWHAGTTVRAIRGQVRTGPEGKIYSIALSPDGRWLATGGYLGALTRTKPTREDREEANKIRLYEYATGKLVALLKGHLNIVSGLAFSPDGKLLISGGFRGDPPIIWDLEKRTPIHRLQGHEAEVPAVGFTSDGLRAVTGSYDTTLKLWSVNDGKEIVTLRGHHDHVQSVAISPVGGLIASGDRSGEIRLWDGHTGGFLRVLANHGGIVGALRFSPDGELLLSACGGSGCNHEQYVWEVATGREVVVFTEHNNSVAAASVSPDGQLAATGGGNSRQIYVWDIKTGKSKKVLAGSGAHRWAVGFSTDGLRIAWGSTLAHQDHNARGPIEFELQLPGGQSFVHPQPITRPAVRSVVRANASFGAYSLVHRKGGGYGFDAILDIKKDGQTIASIERPPHEGYQHLAYSFTPDGNVIVSGGNGGALTAYDLNGGKIGSFIGHESEVWAVTPSPDGRLLVSGSGDQTVRLWNLKTRELIVTLFHGTDGEWVMWTPQGYYMGSPGADRIVGWQINKGPDKEADYVGAGQLRDHLHRPDIVEQAIILASAEQAVREAPGTSFKLADLLARPVPRFKIVSPEAGSARRGGRGNIKLAIDATPDPVRLIRAHVNGRQVAEYTPPTDSGGFGAGEFFVDVPFARGRNEVRIMLINAIGEKHEALTLTHEGDGDLDKRGTLHILAVGVSDYKSMGPYCGNDGCDLKSPSADARKFAEAAEKHLGQSHKTVSTRVLVNGSEAADAPTVGNIIDALDALKRAEETDTVVLFIAGHGVNEGHSYRFLPTNAEHVNGAFRGSTVVPWQFLQETIESAKGRRLLFVDTCHSGNAYNQRLGNAAFHANIIAYTAARFDQLAIEDYNLGHGLFTYALVEGLEGKGGLGAKGQISTKDLHDYVVRRVRELAIPHKREQEPQYFKGRDAEEFVLARW